MKKKSHYTVPASTFLAKSITEIDKNDKSEGSPLNFTQATVIAWKILSEYKYGSSKRDMISNILQNLPIIYTQPKNGNERKGKFTSAQIDRTYDVLNTLLKGYWWPWSSIRKSLRDLCK